MFQKSSKKRQQIRRAIVSVISVIAVLVIVTGTILFALGYRLDGDKGRLEQGALVQFDSKPGGATVSVDGKTIGKTATKQSVIAGDHTFIMTKTGYDSWAKSLALSAGTLNWLDYARLVPKDLPSETVVSYKTVAGELASPDNKTMLIQEKADAPTFQVVDLRAQDVKSTSITLPTSLYSEATTEGTTHTFTMMRWDSGGRYMLVKHTYGDKSEWIVLDTQSVSSSVNVSTLLNISVADLHFAGTNGTSLYGLTTDGILRKLDLSAATISRGLISNVSSFDVFDNNIITYVGLDPNDATHQVAGIYRDGDASPHVLRTENSLTTPLSIATTRFFADDYVAIADGLKVTVLKGSYPVTAADDSTSLKQFGSFTVSAPVDQLSFSPEGDYLVAQSGLNFISYELEYQRQTNANVTTSESTSHVLQWLDPAYLWAAYDGHLSIREFDGTNVHVINTSEPGFDATLSPNGTYLYTVAKSGDGYQLERVKMIL